MSIVYFFLSVALTIDHVDFCFVRGSSSVPGPQKVPTPRQPLGHGCQSNEWECGFHLGPLPHQLGSPSSLHFCSSVIPRLNMWLWETRRSFSSVSQAAHREVQTEWPMGILGP